MDSRPALPRSTQKSELSSHRFGKHGIPIQSCVDDRWQRSPEPDLSRCHIPGRTVGATGVAAESKQALAANKAQATAIKQPTLTAPASKSAPAARAAATTINVAAAADGKTGDDKPAAVQETQFGVGPTPAVASAGQAPAPAGTKPSTSSSSESGGASSVSVLVSPHARALGLDHADCVQYKRLWNTARAGDTHIAARAAADFLRTSGINTNALHKVRPRTCVRV